MTQYQINSIKASKENSVKLLAKELSYSKQHQSASTISMHKAHIDKMDAMIASA